MDVKGKYKRLFVFGCSFSKWCYPTYADVLATELSPTVYRNFGQAGAGNQFIFLKAIEADLHFDFNEDDLVICQWTNVCREDRYRESGFNGWVTPGNIFSQTVYPDDFVDSWANVLYYMQTNYPMIYALNNTLKNKTNLINLQMLDIFEFYDQWSTDSVSDKERDISNFYKDNFVKKDINILPSFYKVLWDNNINNKLNDLKLLHTDHYDAHPTIVEHSRYIQEVLNISFSIETENKVKEAQQNYNGLLLYNYNGDTTLSTQEFNSNVDKQVYSKFLIDQESQSSKFILDR